MWGGGESVCFVFTCIKFVFVFLAPMNLFSLVNRQEVVERKCYLRMCTRVCALKQRVLSLMSTCSLDANVAPRTAALTDTTLNHRKDCSDVTFVTSRTEIRRTKREKSLLGGFTAEHFRTATGDGQYKDKVILQGSVITQSFLLSNSLKLHRIF